MIFRLYFKYIINEFLINSKPYLELQDVYFRCMFHLIFRLVFGKVCINTNKIKTRRSQFPHYILIDYNINDKRHLNIKNDQFNTVTNENRAGGGGRGVASFIPSFSALESLI